MKSYKNLLALFILLYSSQVLSYKELTHYDMSVAAFKITEIGLEKAYLGKMGLVPYSWVPIFPNPDPGLDSNFKKQCTIKNDGSRYCTIEELLGNGAILEDSSSLLGIKRPLNHFFDPYYDRSLTQFGPNNDLTSLGYKSWEWALENEGELTETLTRPEQQYSYRDANKCFYNALTSENYDDRDFYYACMFNNLGQVIHHVEDMAQPEHTRNDQHIEGLHTSFYEVFTQKRNDNSKKGLDPEYLSYLNSPGLLKPAFSSAKSFWTTSEIYGQRSGMADFSSYNFVTKDTAFAIYDGTISPDRYYPFPEPSQIPAIKDISDPLVLGDTGAQICQEIKNDPEYLFIPDQPCVVEFIQTSVVDNLQPETNGINEMAATYSVFDEAIADNSLNVVVDGGQGVQFVDRMVSLNQVNYANHHKYLIPRAVSYSAGLIDHFFRGDVTMSTKRDSYFDTDVDEDGFYIYNFSKARKGWPHLESNFVSDIDETIDGQIELYYWALNPSKNEYIIKPLPGALYSTSGPLQYGDYISINLPETLPSDMYSNELRLVFKGKIGEDGDELAGSDPENTNYSVAVDNWLELPYSLIRTREVGGLQSSLRTGEEISQLLDGDASETIQTDVYMVSFNGREHSFNHEMRMERFDPLMTNDNYDESRDLFRVIVDQKFVYQKIGKNVVVVEYDNGLTTDWFAHDIGVKPTPEEAEILREFYKLVSPSRTSTYYPYPTESEISQLPYGYRVLQTQYGYISKFLDNYNGYGSDLYVNSRKTLDESGNFLTAHLYLSSTPGSHFDSDTGACRYLYMNDINVNWPQSNNINGIDFPNEIEFDDARAQMSAFIGAYLSEFSSYNRCNYTQW